MNKIHKNIIIGIGVVIIFIIVIWMAEPGAKTSQSSTTQVQGDSTANGSGGKLITTEQLYDFGTISMEKGKVSHNFTIKNDSDAPVELTKLYTSCMCTTAILKARDWREGPYGMPGHGFIPRINRALQPSEEAELIVEFDPAAHGPAGVGPIERVVALENKTGKPLEVTIKANVTP